MPLDRALAIMPSRLHSVADAFKPTMTPFRCPPHGSAVLLQAGYFALSGDDHSAIYSLLVLTGGGDL
jgi:hypothetical protein